MFRAINDAVEYVKLGRQFRKLRPYTMIHNRPFRENLLLAKRALLNPALNGGAIVECGTWKGGMAAALVEIGGPHRAYYFFDSFQGLPTAEAIDGKSAKDYQANTKDPEYFDNCRASIDDLKSALSLVTDRTDHIRIIPGFFEDSFKEFKPPQIAVLRLDGDWYSSTMICLQKFWDHVSARRPHFDRRLLYVGWMCSRRPRVSVHNARNGTGPAGTNFRHHSIYSKAVSRRAKLAQFHGSMLIDPPHLGGYLHRQIEQIRDPLRGLALYFIGMLAVVSDNVGSSDAKLLGRVVIQVLRLAPVLALDLGQ